MSCSRTKSWRAFEPGGSKLPLKIDEIVGTEFGIGTYELLMQLPIKKKEEARLHLDRKRDDTRASASSWRLLGKLCNFSITGPRIKNYSWTSCGYMKTIHSKK